jgi:hypothetical protein
VIGPAKNPELGDRQRNAIFVPGIGQYDNIGDLILRRQLLDWLRPHGQLFIYVGESPSGYDDGLRLDKGDRVFRSFLHWYLLAFWGSVRGRVTYVFKPGEIQLSLKGMKEHVGMLPVILAARLRGGAVIRVGAGSRNFSPLPRLLMLPSVWASTYTRWRDKDTASYMGRGGVMPDLAFGEGTRDLSINDSPEPRRKLIVSMRSDRPYPPQTWFDGIKTYAAEHGLEIVAVTQVLRDEQRSARLAVDLEGQHLSWNGSDHDGQELKLRSLYRTSAMVVSDRLHVLISGLTEGAVPVALQVDSSRKIARHFEAASFTNVSMDVQGRAAHEITAFLTAMMGSRDAVLTSLSNARAELNNVGAEVADVVRGQSRTRYSTGAAR